ncbi:MAG: hypothetical protein ACE5LL_00430 [Alphaproteobacteria bacterium]
MPTRGLPWLVGLWAAIAVPPEAVQVADAGLLTPEAAATAGPGPAEKPAATPPPRTAETSNTLTIPEEARNPCNPFGWAHFPAPIAPELPSAEVQVAYEGVVGEMVARYRLSGIAAAADYQKWRRYNTAPYPSAAHGGWYINHYANGEARAYGRYEGAGVMPLGSVLAKDSFSIAEDGTVGTGPLFLMEKMAAGFNANSGDWRYTMIMPDGSIFGTTNGVDSRKVAFCVPCHGLVDEGQDHMFFLPKDLRVRD